MTAAAARAPKVDVENTRGRIRRQRAIRQSPIARWISERRIALRLYLKDVARAASISAGEFQDIALGLRLPRLSTIRRLETVLGPCPADVLKWWQERWTAIRHEAWETAQAGFERKVRAWRWPRLVREIERLLRGRVPPNWEQRLKPLRYKVGKAGASGFRLYRSTLGLAARQLLPPDVLEKNLESGRYRKDPPSERTRQRRRTAVTLSWVRRGNVKIYRCRACGALRHYTRGRSNRGYRYIAERRCPACRPPEIDKGGRPYPVSALEIYLRRHLGETLTDIAASLSLTREHVTRQYSEIEGLLAETSDPFLRKLASPV